MHVQFRLNESPPAYPPSNFSVISVWEETLCFEDTKNDLHIKDRIYTRTS